MFLKRIKYDTIVDICSNSLEGSKLIKPDFSRLDMAWKRAQELIPSLREADVEPRAAVFSMTADGYPLVCVHTLNLTQILLKQLFGLVRKRSILFPF